MLHVCSRSLCGCGYSTHLFLALVSSYDAHELVGLQKPLESCIAIEVGAATRWVGQKVQFQKLEGGREREMSHEGGRTKRGGRKIGRSERREETAISILPSPTHISIVFIGQSITQYVLQERVCPQQVTHRA